MIVVEEVEPGLSVVPDSTSDPLVDPSFQPEKVYVYSEVLDLLGVAPL